MNRREAITGTFLTLYGTAVLADCRDDNGMIGPDWHNSTCLDLTMNEAAVSGKQTGRALFAFGAYEELIAREKDKATFPFEFNGKAYRIRVTRLTIDVNRKFGCVVCEVHGRVWL